MIFKDPKLQEDFEAKGFAIVPSCFTVEDINELLDFHIQFDPNLDSGFKTSVWSANKEYRNKAFQTLLPLYEERLKPVLNNHRGIMGNYMIKEAKANSKLDLHADWAFTNEVKHAAINAWVPLVDTSLENGCLRILPYSNHFNYQFRGRNIVHQFQNLQSYIEKLTIPIPVKAGDAILFNVKCIHFSEDNNSSESRPAVSMVMVPRESEVLHYTNLDSSQIRKIEVREENFFSDFNAFESIPTQPIEEEISFNRKQRTLQEFEKLYEVCKKPNSWKSKWYRFFGLDKVNL